ncbi:MAG TPA: hypothetical protein PK199_09110, partial [Bacteroidales bacterium]|nr:hypothetical protein [Bacteroidales bacterium]
MYQNTAKNATVPIIVIHPQVLPHILKSEKYPRIHFQKKNHLWTPEFNLVLGLEVASIFYKLRNNDIL